jgi:hypothetical protein
MVGKARTLIEWCEYNQLYINWSKTKAMFVTNKRAELPSSINVDGHDIEVVSSFKLLGVTLDTKLNFMEHIDSVSAQVRKRVFAIRRVFYLSFSVKLQFLKAFVLPYFDYCLSLVIYFSKTAITRLARLYYMSLRKLLHLELGGLTTSEINSRLSEYGLSSFHHRFASRILTLFHKIKFCKHSPTELKQLLTVNKSNRVTRTANRLLLEQPKAKSAYGERTFDFFFSRFFNSVVLHRVLFVLVDYRIFLSYLYANIDSIVTGFIRSFSLFDLRLDLAFVC